MKLRGSYHIPAPQERVWQKLQDPETIARCLPGCQRLEPTGENTYAMTLKVQIGAVRGDYQGTVRISDVDAPRAYRMWVESHTPGGFVQGNGWITLETKNEGTEVSYDGEVQVGGKLAGVGHRMVRVAARMLINQFFKAMAKEATGDEASAS